MSEGGPKEPKDQLEIRDRPGGKVVFRMDADDQITWDLPGLQQLTEDRSVNANLAFGGILARSLLGARDIGVANREDLILALTNLLGACDYLPVNRTAVEAACGALEAATGRTRREIAEVTFVEGED